MFVLLMLWVPGSKILNLVKEIDTESSPQRRPHCTPPHNSRKHGERLMSQNTVPTNKGFSNKTQQPEHAQIPRALHNEERTPKQDPERVRTIWTLYNGNQFLKGALKHKGTLCTPCDGN